MLDMLVDFNKYKTLEIFSYASNKNFTLNCPLKYVLMHANRRTDMKDIGYYSDHAKAYINVGSSRGNFARQEFLACK